jgi:hypothetical protein
MLFPNIFCVIGGHVSQHIFSSTDLGGGGGGGGGQKKHNDIRFIEIPPIFSNFPSYPKGTHWVSQEKKIRVVLYSLNG